MEALDRVDVSGDDTSCGEDVVADHRSPSPPASDKARRRARRRASWAVALRRWEDDCRRSARVRRLGFDTGGPTAPHEFFKKSLGCGCRKRRSGQCKYGGGCHGGRRISVDARIVSSRLVRDVVTGRIDPEEVPRPLRFYGLYGLATTRSRAYLGCGRDNRARVLTYVGRELAGAVIRSGGKA